MAGDRRLEVGVAVIGVVGALTGALIGGAVTYLTARQAIGEERSVEVRVQRTTAYTALVATAEQVRRESEALAERCRVARERNERPYSADDTPEDEVFADIECIF
jgi:hypothetical protein